MITKFRERSQITLPASIVKKLNLKPGDNLDIVVEDDLIIIRPVLVIDRSQSWFWSKEWQEREKEVDSDIKEGHLKEAKNVDDLFEQLES